MHGTYARGLLGLVAWACVAFAPIACGGSTPSVATPPEPAPPVAKAPPEPAEPKAKTAPEPTEAELERAKLDAADRQRTEPTPEPREVLYKVTPEGLVVDVDGVRFKPTAEPVKKPNGGYGIRVTVEAEAIDDDSHTLLSPENGPMSFAVTIFDKGGAEHARHGDTRVGDEQQFILPGGPLTLTREWPSGSVAGPLWWGQRVVLQVGLWGLARGTERTRPMKKFFVVEMVGGAKAQAVLTPPEMDPK